MSYTANQGDLVSLAGAIARRRVDWAEVAISPLGLGLSRIASYSANLGRRDALHLLKAALDLGINVFDTADSYGQGDSERLLGDAFSKQRDQVVICTKIGYRLSAKARVAAYVKPILKPLISRSTRAQTSVRTVRAAPMRQDFSPQYLRTAIDRCLRRLRLDAVDLLLLHNPPSSGFPREEATGVLEAARRAGKIRAYGVSPGTFADAEAWLGCPGIAALQVPFGPLEQRASAGFLAEAKNRRVGIIAREVLTGSGALGGLPDAAPTSQPGRPPGANAVGAALCAPLACDGIDVVLVGTTRMDHLQQNTAAVAASLAAAPERSP